MQFDNGVQFLECLRTESDGRVVGIYNEFKIHSVFQRLYDAEMNVIGAEALLRVEDQRGITIRPDLFLQSDTHSEDDLMNIDRLARVMHTINFAMSDLKRLRLFINILPIVSTFPYQKGTDGYTHWNQMLMLLGLTNKQITHEFVEFQCFNESELSICADCVRSSGHLIAIDDFGSGASTIERVNLLKPNVIKLDRSLLLSFMDGDKAGLLDTIHLAKERGCEVVVEGIETEEQLNEMKNLDVDIFQGYYLNRPSLVAPNAKRDLISYFKRFLSFSSPIQIA